MLVCGLPALCTISPVAILALMRITSPWLRVTVPVHYCEHQTKTVTSPAHKQPGHQKAASW